MKILHLNTYDSGGAGVAAINLHRACLVEKIDSQIMFLRESKKRIPNSHGFIKIGEDLDLIEEKKNANKLNLLKKKYQVNGLVDSECITFPRTSFKALINHPLVVTADIIHLHWIARFVDFESFFLKLKKPVVWTFHDSNPFQGIFHYIGDLEKNPWTKEIDLWAEDIKRQAFKHSKIHVVTPSNWMQKRFLLKGFACTSTTVIRNPIPLPSSNIKADSSTNQKITKFIFSAWNLSTKCKRFDLFVKLAETLSSQEIQFFCLGKKENLKIHTSLEKLLNEWNLYKNEIEKLNKLKEELEKNNGELKKAKRNGDLALAGKLTHYELPRLKEKILKLENLHKNILEDKKVTDNDIASILSSWTGIPIDKILEKERDALINLDEILKKRIVGQDNAIQAISSVIKRSRTGINDPNKPIGSFLFLGPTGVGKTEIAKTLSDFLFKDEKELITIDMSEYTEKHSISKLIGAPPGYVGFEESGRLTKAVKDRPFKVILFDEIEKANSEIFNVFLQLLDEGRVVDGQGNSIDFKNTIIILTSNIGSEIILDNKYTKERDIKVLKEVKSYFKPEFLNRLDEIIIFNKLERNNLKSIIENQLAILKNRLKSKNIKILFDLEVVNLLSEKGYSREYGARPLKRLIEKEIGDIIADALINNQIKENSYFTVGVKEGKFKLKITS